MAEWDFSEWSDQELEDLQKAVAKEQQRRHQEWLDLRFAVLKRDGYCCRYCGARGAPGAPLQVDHVMPRSRGGTDDIENLVAACARCNASKGDMTPEEWKHSGRPVARAIRNALAHELQPGMRVFCVGLERAGKVIAVTPTRSDVFVTVDIDGRGPTKFNAAFAAFQRL